MLAFCNLLAILILSALLSGCANFDTIRTFAKDGSTVAAVAKKDVDNISTSCTDIKGEMTVLAYASSASSVDAKRTPTCNSVPQAFQVVAESLSVRLLVKYHEALNALAGQENWSLDKEIETLGSEVKKVQVDGKALVSADDVGKYQSAFTAIADLVTSALREREAKLLLSQELNWVEVLRPLRFWYGGADGKSASPYSRACEIVKTDWVLVQSGLMDYVRCQVKTVSGIPACEPLTAAARLVAVDEKIKPFAACASGISNDLPPAAAARAKLIDSWLEANDELRRTAFEENSQVLLERLTTLREQANAIKKAFD